jgi:hypothetical protein
VLLLLGGDQGVEAVHSLNLSSQIPTILITQRSGLWLIDEEPEEGFTGTGGHSDAHALDASAGAD